MACLSGLPPLPPPSAELTTVWGTSEDLGCHAAGQESHAEGTVGQSAPAHFPSPPQSLSPVQHKFTSKMVRDSASLSSGGVGRGENYGVGARLSFIPQPLSSACKGNGWRQWDLAGRR